MAHDPEPDPVEAWPLPALLRAARAAIGASVRRALDTSGFDDLPPNGPYVLGAIARGAAPLGSVIRQLGVSKQTAGQLVDTLVARGYLHRQVDADDRRRLMVSLTDRGKAAAAVTSTAVGEIETELQQRVGSEQTLAARQALAALIEWGATNG